MNAYFQAILSWLNHPENEQDGVEEEEVDLEEPTKSEDDSYVDSKAEVVFNILNTFNKKDYEGESRLSVELMLATDVGDKKKQRHLQSRHQHSKISLISSQYFFAFVHEHHPNFILDVTLKPRPGRNQNFEDLIRKCDILEGESEDL